MKKIGLFLLFFSFIFPKDLIEIKYKITAIENIKNEEVKSNVELSIGKNLNKSFEMWGDVSELDLEILEEIFFEYKPKFGLISWYQGKGNLVVLLSKGTENKIIKRDIFESEGDLLSEEEEKKQNNDVVIYTFKNSVNHRILFNMTKQEKNLFLTKVI